MLIIQLYKKYLQCNHEFCERFVNMQNSLYSNANEPFAIEFQRKSFINKAA